MHDAPIRLSKLMAQREICSRREADSYIEAGLVEVDGEVISVLGTKVSPDVHIKLLPKAQKQQRSKVTILLNKPLGYVSTQPEKGYRAAVELITPSKQFRGDRARAYHPSHLRKLAVVGRLDIDSKGLLVFTQDGALAKRLIGPDTEMEKEYIVSVEGDVTPKVIQKLRSGLLLDGTRLKPAKIETLESGLLRITLKQGKKRQIRRMCEQVGLEVVKLKRVRVGGVPLGNLPEGQWRYLRADEIF